MHGIESVIESDMARGVRLRIARGGVARVRNARGALLSVEQGSVWITQSGSFADICLESGKSFRIERNGVTLVTALGGAADGVVCLTRSRRRARSVAGRFAAGLRRLRFPRRASAGAV